MKIALVQCDVISGALQHNSAKVLAAVKKAPKDALCILPTDTLTGPQNHCLLREPCFRESLRQTLDVLKNEMPTGQLLLCAIASIGTYVIYQQQIQEAEHSFHWQGYKIALPGEGMQGDVCVNTGIRPFILERQAEWEMILSAYARQTGIPQISVNLVGGYGGAIYNGQSFYAGSDGQILGRAKAFEEDLLILELDQENRIEPLCASDEEALWRALTLGLSDFVHKAGAQKAILGLSGGIDSAMVACLATHALGSDNLLAVLMPSRFTSHASITDSMALAANLGIRTVTIPIEQIKSAFLEELAPAFHNIIPPAPDLTEENLQARIRGVILMALANRTGALVLNTGNKSEGCMGYSTLYGDSVGAVAVIGDLFKTQVYKLARWFCMDQGRQIIPENILTRAPSAELAPNQKDTDSLPPYDILDPLLASLLGGTSNLPAQEQEDLRRRINASAFKRRQSPPPLSISDLRPCVESDN